MLQGDLVLPHLGQNSAYVEVDVTRVRNDERVVYRVFCVVKALVFDFESLLEIGEGGAKLLRSPKEARVVVVGYGSNALALLGERLGLLE